MSRIREFRHSGKYLAYIKTIDVNSHGTLITEKIQYYEASDTNESSDIDAQGSHIGKKESHGIPSYGTNGDTSPHTKKRSDTTDKNEKDVEKNADDDNRPGVMLRYTVLIMACLFSVGTYFAYDSIGVIQQDIQQFFGVNRNEFGLLYSVYTVPNVLLPFLGGYMIDRVGLAASTLVACLMIGVGSTVVALSPYFDLYWLMIAGRFIFGVGAEVSYVAQNTICYVWFKEKELALAMGFTLGAGRLGAFFTFNANAWAVSHFNDFRAALWLGALMSVLSFVAGLIYYILHKLANSRGKNVGGNVQDEKISLGVVLRFPKTFWVIVLLCTAFYAVFYPIQSFGPVFLHSLYGINEQKASSLISIIPLICLFLSPFFGWLVDKYGKNSFIVTAGIVLMLVSLGAMLFSIPFQPIVSLVALGIVFSAIPAAVWPAVAVIVPDQYQGMGFGLLSGVLNLGLTVLYFWNFAERQIYIFIGATVLALVLSIFWNIRDIHAKHSGSGTSGHNKDSTHYDESRPILQSP